MLPEQPPRWMALSQLPKRVYLVSALLVVSVLGIYSMAIRPQREVMNAQLEEVRQQEAMLNLLAVEMAKINGSRRQMEQLEKAVVAFEDRLPKKSEMDVILGELWLIGEAADLKTGIRKHKEGSADDLRIISLQGRFEGIYSFLVAMERLPSLMKVQGLSVRNINERADGELEAIIVLNVFCRQ